MDTSALNSPTLRSSGIDIYEQYMVAAPGGPITTTTGDDGGAVIQIKNDMSGYRTIATQKEVLPRLELARSTSGTTYMDGVGPTESIALFQAGSNAGQTTFPVCANAYIDTSLAAGRSVAVLAATACNHVWIRTISPGGEAGRLVKIGSAPASDGDWVSAVADRAGHFTVVWVNAAGDLSVARSSNGSHWKTSRGAVPISTDGGAGTISTGLATWYAFSAEALPEDRPTHRTVGRLADRSCVGERR